MKMDKKETITNLKKILSGKIFLRQIDLIMMHFEKNKTLDWETCVEYLKKGVLDQNIEKDFPKPYVMELIRVALDYLIIFKEYDKEKKN